MQLRIGPFTYHVRWVAGYIDYAGQRCLGLCDNERHELLISDQAGAMQQFQVLCHEYMEAWVYHFAGQRPSKEDYCDLFGLAMTQLVADFASTEPTSTPTQTSDSPSNHKGALHATLGTFAQQFAPSSEPSTHEAPDPSRAAIGDEMTRAVSVHNPDHQHTAPPTPGQPRPWRVRIYEPDSDK